MRMKTFVAALAVFLPVPAILAEEGKKPAAKDEDSIRGSWVMVSGDKGGEPAPEKFVKTFRMTFAAAGKLTAREKEEDQEGTFKLDAAKKPRHIDISIDGKMLEGIYALEGDSLKLCVSEGSGRPADFKSPEGSKVMVIVLKRDKK